MFPVEGVAGGKNKKEAMAVNAITFKVRDRSKHFRRHRSGGWREWEHS